MPSIRLPLTTTDETRDSGRTKDALLQNLYTRKSQDKFPPLYARPAFVANAANSDVSNGRARGCYYWHKSLFHGINADTSTTGASARVKYITGQIDGSSQSKFVWLFRTGVVYTSDDGSVWRQTSDASLSTAYDIVYDSTNALWIIVGSGGGCKTTADLTTGATWTSRTTGTTEALLALQTASGVTLAVGTNLEIVRSTNGGVTWAAPTTAPSGITTLQSVDMSGSDAVAVGPVGQAYVSTDAGANWASASLSGGSKQLYAVSYGAANTIVAVGQDNQVWYSTDNGITWNSETVDGSTQDYVSLIYNSTDAVWLAGSENGVARSTSATGGLWEEVSGPYGYRIAVKIDTTTIVYVGAHSLTRATSVSPDGYVWETAQSAEALYYITDNVLSMYDGNTHTNLGTIVVPEGDIVYFDTINTPTPTLLVQIAGTSDGSSPGNLYYLTPHSTHINIDDADFPAVEGKRVLAPGVVSMDGYAFVLTTAGEIYNSDLQDIASWNALAFISAELEGDEGRYIAKHKNHIVAFGEHTIEFFYNAAAAAPASPLERRNDIRYHLGIVDARSAAGDEDTLFFVGSSPHVGSMSIKILKDFQLADISTPYINQLLEESHSDGVELVGSVLMSGGTQFYVLFVNTTTPFTLIYNTATQQWHEWYIQDRNGQSEWYTGTTNVLDIITTTTASDGTVLAQLSYGEIYEAATETSQDEGSNPIERIITTPRYMLETRKSKFFKSLSLEADQTTTSSTVNVQWSDDDYQTWSTARTVDLNDDYPFLSRLGMSRRRAFRFTYTDNDNPRFYGIELDVDIADH